MEDRWPEVSMMSRHSIHTTFTIKRTVYLYNSSENLSTDFKLISYSNLNLLLFRFTLLLSTGLFDRISTSRKLAGDDIHVDARPNKVLTSVDEPLESGHNQDDSKGDHAVVCSFTLA